MAISLETLQIVLPPKLETATAASICATKHFILFYFLEQNQLKWRRIQLGKYIFHDVEHEELQDTFTKNSQTMHANKNNDNELNT